mmetsp:Transcript_97679/g.209607  ORF Transcript_97679/g.209607 Transcript_97679/m.209607 type:complete len:268 (-) Transcript_97679:213-1016(-)
MAGEMQQLPLRASAGGRPLVPMSEAARELPEAELMKVNFYSKQQLMEVLAENRHHTVDVHVDDVINMMAELRGVSRSTILQMAVTAWFYHALGFPVVEAECHQQPATDDSSGGFLLFRVRLEANHALEVSGLSPGENLAKKYRDLLMSSLPGDLKARKQASFSEQMVQISWTRPGSVELGGVAALGVVVLIVMAIGIGSCRCEFCNCRGNCPCLARPGSEQGHSYHCALLELRERGADFEVSPDGSASLRVPPYRDRKWRCPECAIL